MNIKMSKKEKLDRFHYHEALDRAYVLTTIIDDILLSHPIVKKHENIKKKVEEALELLVDAYQAIGQKSVDKFSKKKAGN